MSQRMNFDALIIGGGPVGASAAIALAQAGLQVAVVEPVPADALHQPSYDGRSLVLNHASMQILGGLGLLPGLSGQHQPVAHIHVSQMGRLGTTRLHAGDMGVEALGHVVEAAALGQALRRGLEETAGISLLCPAKLLSFRQQAEQVEATISTESGEQLLTAPVMVAADGQNSLVRQQLGIGVDSHDYGQTAVVSTVTPQLPHNGWAWERFTRTGPLAMLPRVGQRLGVVWCAETEQAKTLMALDDEAWLAAIQKRFGFRLGRLQQPGKRMSYPLRRLQARQEIAPRVVLVGNASHAVHPVAGQGFNLGLRDVAWLAEVFAQAHAEHTDLGADPVLLRYHSGRSLDQQQTLQFTDNLVRLFSNDWPLLGHLRGLGLIGADVLPGAKASLARGAMGYRGRLSRLARGERLDKVQP